MDCAKQTPCLVGSPYTTVVHLHSGSVLATVRRHHYCLLPSILPSYCTAGLLDIHAWFPPSLTRDNPHRATCDTTTTTTPVLRDIGPRHRHSPFFATHPAPTVHLLYLYLLRRTLLPSGLNGTFTLRTLGLYYPTRLLPFLDCRLIPSSFNCGPHHGLPVYQLTPRIAPTTYRLCLPPTPPIYITARILLPLFTIRVTHAPRLPSSPHLYPSHFLHSLHGVVPDHIAPHTVTPHVYLTPFAGLGRGGVVWLLPSVYLTLCLRQRWIHGRGTDLPSVLVVPYG